MRDSGLHTYDTIKQLATNIANCIANIANSLNHIFPSVGDSFVHCSKYHVINVNVKASYPHPNPICRLARTMLLLVAPFEDELFKSDGAAKAFDNTANNMKQIIGRIVVGVSNV